MMTDKVRVCYELPEGVCSDMEFMVILQRAYLEYEDKLTPAEMGAALLWFNNWIVSRVDRE